ncbi:MAG: bifunctional shikimate kinase/3-dehydroquinate synthase [Myxococcota bacterium]
MNGGTVLLAGPPGSGKSTVGRAVAERRDAPFVDLDDLIEARAGSPPAEILEGQGEARFRALEAEALEAIEAPAVIALGGGALTTERGRELARRLGPVVRLDVEVAELQRRVDAQGQARPLLEGGFEKLLQDRARSYAAVDVFVDGHGAPDEVASRVDARSANLRTVTSRFLDDETRILVGRGLEDAVAGAVQHLRPGRPVLLVADAGVPRERRASLATKLASAHPLHVESVPGGEAVKDWSVLGGILDRALKAGCGRQSVVVGLGGGAVCDLANLVAHLLGRGAASVLVPTTLLSQVDASVGGKCAVNHAEQRNSIGAFHAPRDVITDLELLESLAPEDYRAGIAEVLKMGLIGDETLFAALERGDRPSVGMVARAVELKAQVVAEDPREYGLRKVLNLGHTLGHALEAASGFSLRHGEAVGMGLVASARASVRAGYAAPEVAERVEAAVERWQLPTRPSRTLLAEAGRHFGADKKSDAHAIDWVAIRQVGEVSIERMSLDDVRATLVEYGERDA